MKTREELIAKNEAYRSSLTNEVDQAQEEILNLAKKALIAGGVALTINLVRNAFFVKDKKKKKGQTSNMSNSFLSNELTRLAIVELLHLASTKLSDFLEKQEQIDEGQ